VGCRLPTNKNSAYINSQVELHVEQVFKLRYILYMFMATFIRYPRLTKTTFIAEKS
jgi:hypothetical protein